MNRPCCRSIVLLAAVLGGTADGQRSVAGRAAGPAERAVACAPDPLVPGVEFTRITVDTGEIVIARVTRAVVAPDDGLWVLDGTGPVIVKLDSAGRLQRAITARGEGPGELSQPEAMAVRPDGALLVADRKPPRVLEFDAAGRFRGSRPIPAAAVATDLDVGADGRLYIATAFGTARRLVERRFFVRVVDSTGREAGLDEVDDRRLAEDPLRGSMVVAAYVAVSPSGVIVTTYQPAYVLRWFDPRGTLLREHAGCQGTIGDSKREVRREGRVGVHFRPFAYDLAFDRQGVLYHLTPSEDGGYHLLDRYSPDGERLRPILLPGRGAKGTYLGMVLPTSRPDIFWGYNPITGEIFRLVIDELR